MNKNVSILIVDDEESVRVLLSEWLSGHYRCDTAESTDRAAELLASRYFNLVLTDIMMPGPSGLELCQLVHQRCPGTAVLVMSGSNDIHHATEAMRQGALFYVSKPFDLPEILSVVRTALRHQARLSGPLVFKSPQPRVA